MLFMGLVCKQLLKTEWVKAVSLWVLSVGTLSSSVFKGTVSPVRSTSCDNVASSLQNWGFSVRSSSVTSHKGTEARTVRTKCNKSLINVNKSVYGSLSQQARLFSFNQLRYKVVYLVDVSCHTSQVLVCVWTQDRRTLSSGITFKLEINRSLMSESVVC